MTGERRPLMPPRVLPWLYFGVAHLSLALAFAAIAWDARAAAGFFYHARLVGIVHLITLGWITASILGALYLVGPLALRTPMPARWSDAAAFASVTIGIVGMVAHFWLEEFGGMAWSGLMAALGIFQVGIRTMRGLRRAPVPFAVKLHVLLAFVNIGGAATMGVLLGFDKVYHFLPGFVLANVVAHAHFAAVGWASMMIVGIGYRVLPMMLPARMPGGRSLYASAILLETGAVGLFVTLLLRLPWTILFVAATVAGFAAFGAHVVGMLKHRRPRPRDLPPVDYAMRHAWLAFASLALTVALGVILVLASPSDVTMRAAIAYGVFGLVGFLAQMVTGVQIRLLPLLAWYTAAHRAPTPDALPSMKAMSAQPLAGLSWLLWLWSVPALATGFFVNGIPLVTAGAAGLTAAAIVGAIQAGRLALYAFAGRRISSAQHGTEPRRLPERQPVIQAAER
jgi:hypothetical protein